LGNKTGIICLTLWESTYFFKNLKKERMERKKFEFENIKVH